VNLRVSTVRTWSLVIFFGGLVVFSIAVVAYERPLGALAFVLHVSLLTFIATEAFGPIAMQRPRLARVLARVYVAIAGLVVLVVAHDWIRSTLA